MVMPKAHAGREMKGGTLKSWATPENSVDASYIGDWRGMSGGKIPVHGDAGKQLR